MSQQVTALYRSYLRQVKALPHSYLRLFFRVKGADDFRSLVNTDSNQLFRKKLKRVSKDLRRLREANAGQTTAFDRILDIAYGRVGKLRWELMEPLLLDASPTMNPRSERVRSPTYSPELAALLTSGVSRTTKALQKYHLVSPPDLLVRAGSNDEDSTLLGPLSRRREYNIRWRFFKREWKKVYPPLQVSLQHPESYTNPLTSSGHPFNLGFHTLTTLQELTVLAGSPSRSPDPPSKRKPHRIPNTLDANPFDGKLPVRWLRRRYQALLGRIPLLVPRFGPHANVKRTYDVQLTANAITPRSYSSRLRVADEDEFLWICSK